jgi:3',5'-cyclic AMP phosphodiesterase CpdA
MIVAQISDSHIALDGPDAARRLSDLAVTIADINALTPLPDAIVHTGDVTHNGRPDEYAAAAAILAEARSPLYVLTGNKDDRANLCKVFAGGGYLSSDFPFVQYGIERHPVRLIALDTQGAGNKGAFCARRFEHLTGMLDLHPATPAAVFAHHPPFLVTEGPEPIHFESQETLSRLREVLFRSGRVVAVLSGHVHRAAWGDVVGIPATVMPAIATTLRHGGYPPNLRGRPVYHVHRFDPTWGIVSEARIAGTLTQGMSLRGYR